MGGPALGMTSPAQAKSLMKTRDLASRRNTTRPAGASPLRAVVATIGRYRKPSVATRQQKIEERIAAAAEEMAGGITEAASAAEELRRAMEQIASGAEEAASASEETLAVATNTAAGLAQARGHAESARERTDALQGFLADAVNQIGMWASNIKYNEERQGDAIANIEQLREQAPNIGDVTKTVGHVADQTTSLGDECRHRGQRGRRSRTRLCGRRRRVRGARGDRREGRSRGPTAGRTDSGTRQSPSPRWSRWRLMTRRPRPRRARPSFWR